jgi:hypothetical protein
LALLVLIGAAMAARSGQASPPRPALPPLSSLEFKYAVTDLADLDAVQRSVFDAATTASTEVLGRQLDARKCRAIRFYAVKDGDPIVRVREKLDKKCAGDSEDWDLTVKFRSSQPLEALPEGIPAKIDKFELDLTYDPPAQKLVPAWSLSFEESGTGRFPYYLQWINDRVPGSARPVGAPCGTVLAARWTLGSVRLEQEPVEIEAEKWTWAGDSEATRDKSGRTVAAEVSFKVKRTDSTPAIDRFAEAMGRSLSPQADVGGSKTGRAIECR